jgi:hypothetical protein
LLFMNIFSKRSSTARIAKEELSQTAFSTLTVINYPV